MREGNDRITHLAALPEGTETQLIMASPLNYNPTEIDSPSAYMTTVAILNGLVLTA